MAPAIDWQHLLQAAAAEQRLMQLVLSRPSSPASVSKVSVRAIAVRGATHYQWTIRRGTQEFHENLDAAELLMRVEASLGTKYGDLHWFADDGDYTVRAKGPSQWKVQRKPPSKTVAETSHNRRRNYLIPDDRPCPFLQEVGVMLPDGRVKPSMFHKFRQINRYLEFVNDVYGELPAEGPIRVVDFGCGKSYLTFALHYFLTSIRRREVEIVGLDRKADVVEHCQGIAERLELRGLRFTPGEIHTFQPADAVHLAVSLHACDTATDDALANALRWQSRVIFAVPCCQHELARLIPGEKLPGLTGYGLFRERFAAMATDALRARFLETQGYRTQVIEFIETEHTPKNVLLRAVRRGNTEQESAERMAEYQQLTEDLGITGWHLDSAVTSL